MEFKKYSSIENSYRTKTIHHIFQGGYDAGEWSVTEKAHGSNVGVYYNGEEIKWAKRTSFIGDLDNFQGHTRVRDRYDDLIIKVWNYLKGKFGNLEQIIVYGELFGGSYDHPEVKEVPEATRVQKGVEYTPENEFYPFDIKVNGSYVDVDLFIEVCENVGFPVYAKELFRGSFQECLKYPNEFNSTIPNILGLPELKENICEGVVIKPVEPKYFPCGSRVILKNKNEKWSEKSKASKKKNSQVLMKLSDEGKELFSEATAYITENRLRNVLSKLGDITDKMFGALMGNMSKDVLEDFCKDFDDKFTSLPKSEQSVFKKSLNGEVANFIRPKFRDIIDKTF